MLLDTAERISYDSAWDTPYSILVVFALFFLLYLIASIIKKAKQPRVKGKKVMVRVASIRKSRVQMNHSNVSIDGLRNGSATIPGALCDVTFVDEVSGEMFIFSVNEHICDKFKLGDKGELIYKGDAFISFSYEKTDEEKEIEIERKVKVRKMVKGTLLGVLGVVLIVFGSVMLIEENKKIDEKVLYDENGERPLVVYLSGSIENYGEEDEYITSWYQLGDMPQTTEKWGEAYIFRDAIERYRKQTNEEIVIKHFSGTKEMLDTAYEEWKNGYGPDVLIGDYTQEAYCLYPYIEGGMFEDLLPYFENDEMYSGGEYVSEVLEAGLINGEQLVFPITFNMNLLFTSQEKMQRHEIWLSDDMYYEDMLDLFRSAWREVRDKDEYLMVQFTNMRNNYPYILFQSASGESPIDYETGKITLSKELFTNWASLYQSYICDEYDMTRDELKYVQEGDGIQEKDSKYGKWLLSGRGLVNEMFDVRHDNTFCFAEGGNCSYFFHSFVANARYFESRLDEYEEEMVCIGIPTSTNPDGYAAQVTTFGVVLAESKNADKGYEFIKTLADSNTWMHLDLPVNKQCIADTMQEISTSYYDYYPSLGRVSPPKGDTGNIEWLGDPVKLKPLSFETKEYLQNMIEHVEVATLPEYGLTKVITEEIEDYLWGDTESIDEAYNKTIERFVELGYTE